MFPQFKVRLSHPAMIKKLIINTWNNFFLQCKRLTISLPEINVDEEIAALLTDPAKRKRGKGDDDEDDDPKPKKSRKDTPAAPGAAEEHPEPEGQPEGEPDAGEDVRPPDGGEGEPDAGEEAVRPPDGGEGDNGNGDRPPPPIPTREQLIVSIFSVAVMYAVFRAVFTCCLFLKIKRTQRKKPNPITAPNTAPKTASKTARSAVNRIYST